MRWEAVWSSERAMKKRRKDPKLSVSTTTIRVIEGAQFAEPVRGAGLSDGHTNNCNPTKACNKIDI